MKVLNKKNLKLLFSYHNCYEVFDNKNISLILLTETDNNNEYGSKLKEYFLNLSYKELKQLNTSKFAAISEMFCGSYSLIIYESNSASIYTNSNFIGLFYYVDSDNSIIIVDNLELISKRINYELNFSEFEYRNDYVFESSFESIHRKVFKIPGLYYVNFSFSNFKIGSYSWIYESKFSNLKNSSLNDIESIFKPWLKNLPERGDKIYLLMSGGIDSSFLALLLKKNSIPFEAICFSCKTEKGKIGATSEILRSKIICKALDIKLNIIYSNIQEIDSYLYKKDIPLFWDSFIVSPIAYKSAGITSRDIVIDGQNFDSLLGVEYTESYFLKKFIKKPLTVIYETFHRTILHLHYYLKFDNKFAELNIFKASQGGIKFPLPLFFFRNKKNILSKKIPFYIFSSDFNKFSKLNCLEIFRIIRYYCYCEPAVRHRKILLKENNIQLTWPATNSLLISKLLFRKSNLRDIFDPKWQLYDFFKNTSGFDYKKLIKQNYQKESRELLNDNSTKNKLLIALKIKRVYFSLSEWQMTNIYKDFLHKGYELLQNLIKNKNYFEIKKIKEIIKQSKKNYKNARTCSIIGFILEVKRSNWIK